MIEWIETMPVAEKIFFFISLPATLIMIIQTIALFFGGAGDTGLESDTSGMDFDIPESSAELSIDNDDINLQDFADSGLRFITSRGIITFLTVFGWTGVCLMEMGTSIPVSGAFAAILGFGAMVGVAFLVRALMGLQASGNINYREALGKYADVYLTIPPKGEGHGKITMALAGSLSQFDAVTDDAKGIKTGEVVRVTDIMHDSVLVVEREHT